MVPSLDMKNWITFKAFTLGCGIIFLLFAVVIHVFWGTVLEYMVEQQLSLSRASRSYEFWVENPIPLYISFYFFNWTNPSDLKNGSEKPHFEEVGPYAFRERVKKVDLRWNENGTVTYKKHRTWFFDVERSIGTLEDSVTTLNVIALTAARSTKKWNRIARMPLSLILSTTQDMNVTKTIGEFLFQGYTNPLIDFASSVPGLSSQVPFDRFGWFYKRNDSTTFDGVFNVETGANGLDLLGTLRFWNYNNRTQFYEGQCGRVFGSAGDLWPPKRLPKEDIFLFSPDMCRFLEFKYKREEWVGEVKGFRYDSELFDNGTKEPEKGCFCGGACVPSGSANVSSCRFGAPAFVSYPHFYRADPSYLDSVSGLKPDPRAHDTYIILEKLWGIPLEMSIRLQINVLIEPDSGMRMYDGVRKVFFPMIWFEQKVQMPQELREDLNFLLGLPSVGNFAFVVLCVAASLCFFGFSFTVCRMRRKRNEKLNFASEPVESPPETRRPAIARNPNFDEFETSIRDSF